MKTCQICSEPDCTVAVPTKDIRTVHVALRFQYGRGLNWPLWTLAAEVVHEVAAAGRLGSSEPQPTTWAPSSADVHAFGGPLSNFHGTMRVWRAEEIGYYALIALGQAGRLLDRT